MPEESENVGFTLKTYQMFSVHTTPEEFKNTTITGHFGFVLDENLAKEITNLVPMVLSYSAPAATGTELERTLGTRLGDHITIASSFSESFVFKMFSVHTKTQSQRFQIPPV